MQDDRSRGGRDGSLLGRLRGRGRRGRGQPAARLDDWQRVLRGRLLVGLAAFGVWFLAIESRLVYLQVVRHEQLVERAERQQSRSITAHPQRGEIRDREGRVLAYSVDADTIYAVPTDIAEPAATATALCDALDACSEAWRQVIERRLGQKRAFAYVARKVSPEAARRVAALDLDGVGFLKEDRRFYPNRELAGHLLGYVGIDNQGLGGVESTYDDEISGRPGRMLIQTDARRQVFSRVERPPTTGATIELTIDKYLQHIAERELRAAVREHDADGGTVVMLDPHSGELLAVANEPSFNPNAFGTAPAAALRNRAVQDVYEPGSAFKLVTTSAALQEGVARRDELFDVSAGVIRVGGSNVYDMFTYSVLSLEDVIVKSSNVGTIEIGLRVGPERLSDYVRRFGFGQTLSPDLPGESAGIVHRPENLNDRAVASISMGYQVAVTPLQLAAAVGRGRQRRRAARAPRRPCGHPRRPAQRAAAAGDPAGDCPGDRRGADRHHGGGRRAGHGAVGPHSRLHDSRQDGDRREADRRTLFERRSQRDVRRLRALARAAVHHGGDDRHAARRALHRRRGCGARVQARRGGCVAAPGGSLDGQSRARGSGPARGNRASRSGRRPARRAAGPRRAGRRIDRAARHARPAGLERQAGARGARPAPARRASGGRRLRDESPAGPG